MHVWFHSSHFSFLTSVRTANNTCPCLLLSGCAQWTWQRERRTVRAAPTSNKDPPATQPTATQEGSTTVATASTPMCIATAPLTRTLSGGRWTWAARTLCTRWRSGHVIIVSCYRLSLKSDGYCTVDSFIIIFIYPFTAFFPVLHRPLGLDDLQACPFPGAVSQPLPLSALSSSPFHCALQDGPCKMVLVRPDERKHDHTTATCVSLRWSGGLRVVRLPAGSWHGLPRW